MSLILNGTDGLSDVDGSAATPAIRGTDTNTGIFFPAADTIAFSEGGIESMRIDSSGNVSSITDNGTGAYAINFSTSMPDANYGANVSISGQPGTSDACFITTDMNSTARVNPTTSSFAMTAYRFQGSVIDIDYVRVSVFR